MPRASVFDKRIKACIPNCAITSIEKVMADTAIKSQAAETNEIKMSPFNIRMYQIIAWRYGLEINDLPGIVTKSRGFTYDSSQLSCPVLNICGYGEYLHPDTKIMQDEFMKSLQNSRSKMVVTSFEDGASTHCLGENTELLAALLFDWLDDIFN